MKNLIFAFTVVLILMTQSCSDFLDVNPNVSGNDIIQDVSQLDPLLNNDGLTRNAGLTWYSTFFASDDIEISPNLYKIFPGAGQRVALGVWDKETYTNIYSDSYDWATSWTKFFTINTIIEYSDKVTGDAKLKQQLIAEAKFYRAFYHFQLLVQYALHPNVDNGKTPGIGYRDNTDPTDPTERKDVNYTMSRIIEDLEDSEKSLNELGKTSFDIKRNWRITVGTVYSLRARVELYKAQTQADYDKAASYAQMALNHHNTLVDYSTDPLFETTVLDVANKPSKKWKRLKMTENSRNADNFAECYFPVMINKPSAYIDAMPVSQNLYNLYDEKDLRRVKLIDNNYLYVTVSTLPEVLEDEGLTELDAKSYYKFESSGSSFLVGPSTPEMYLIKAEAFARANNTDAAVAELKTLRAKRFNAEDIAVANNITGTLSDVKNERRRELAISMRWYDLKRYNQIEGEQVTITKKSFDNIYDSKTDIITYTLSPTSKFYALPIPEIERNLLNWEQNVYDGVLKQ